MKKIIFTVTNDLSYDQRMQRICTSLASAGFSVMLIGIKIKASPGLAQKKYFQKRLNCWFLKGKLFYIEYNLKLFFFLLFTKADCICAIDLDTILPCWLVSKIKKIKKVYDAHEYFSQLDEIISRPFIYKFWHWIEKKMLPRFKDGYTVCQSIADEFSKTYRVNYEVIRNMPVLQEAEFILQKEKIILYQGAVNKGRGLDQLVAAMKSVNADLWICGEGNYMDELKKAVEVNRVTEKVIFCGMLSPEELKSKTEQSYIGINTFDKKGLNQYLSLANKFFDYIHAGIPQVTMNYPEYRNINKQYKIAVLIDDIESRKIAEGINQLLNDPIIYKMIKENCLTAKKELNWQKEEIKLTSFYKKLLDE